MDNERYEVVDDMVNKANVKVTADDSVTEEQQVNEQPDVSNKAKNAAGDALASMLKMLEDLPGVGEAMAEFHNEVRLIKIDENAVEPKYQHEGDSGFDIASCEKFTLKHGEFRRVRTGLQVAELPDGVELQIRSRSGLASKHGVMCISGTVDSCYRGEIGVILMNFGDDYEVNVGDRIAQCVPMMTNAIPVKMVTKEQLVKTERGEGGFGSTGIENK